MDPDRQAVEKVVGCARRYGSINVSAGSGHSWRQAVERAEREGRLRVSKRETDFTTYEAIRGESGN